MFRWLTKKNNRKVDMKRLTHQQGSVHVGIVALIVLALIGVLGWVYYKNFVAKDSSNTNVASQESSVNVSSATKEYCATYEKLCFTLPSNWSVKDLGQPTGLDYKVDRLQIVDEHGTVALVLQSGISGLGGACVEKDQRELTVLSKDKTNLVAPVNAEQTEYLQNDVYVVKSISKADSDNYIAAMYLTQSKKQIENATMLECSFGMAEMLTGKNVSIPHTEFHGVYMFNIGASTFDTEAPMSTVYASKQEAESSLNTPIMKEAHDVLGSAHYK